MKKILLSLLIVALLAVAGVWYFIFYRPTHNRRDVSKETAVAVAAPDLVKQYVDNEKLADSLYLDKAVEVTGDVVQTGIDATGLPTALLKGQDAAGVAVTFANKQVAVQPNTTIAVQGRATGFLENVTVVEAVLKSSRPVAQTVTAPATPDTTRQQPPATTAVTKGDTSAKQQATAARVFTTSKAQIKFFSSGPAEDIEADNNQAVAKLAESGEVSFAVLIKGFRFDNELMQEHFNGEEYLNSSRFPKATFSGKITDPAAVNFGKDGTYPVTVKGTLQIKGISKPLTAAGTVTVKGKKVTSESKFKVKFTDFQVKTWDKDASEVEITVTAAYN